MTSPTKRSKKTDAENTEAPVKPRRKKTPAPDAAPQETSSLAPTRTKLARRPAPVTLVTGGTGFLGRHLLRVLVDEGTNPVRVLTTNAPAWLREITGVEVVEGSILLPEDASRAVAGASEIYHLAGYVSRRPEDNHKMHRLHVEGTRILCDAARAAGVSSMVLASSSGTIAASDDPSIIHDEESQPPIELIARWGYYASKLYQERTAAERFHGEGRRLVTVNPSLLLGPGDERLSSTQIVLDFLARRHPITPSGGLNFVDVRDAAAGMREAMRRGRAGERYLLGSVNWTFDKFFARLERISKVAAPRLAVPKRLSIFGARGLDAFYKGMNWTSPVEPQEIEQAEHFWYFTSTKAERELGFVPRDPAETLQDTVTYVRRNFIGNKAFAS